MARELDAAPAALVDSGHYRRWSAVVIKLGDEDNTVLRFACAEQTVGGNSFLGNLKHPQPLKLSLQGQVTDRQQVQAQNLDLILGQQLTGLTSALNGAQAMVGTLLQDNDGGTVYYDERVPCDVTTGAVTREWAELLLLAEMYAGFIAGVTVGEIFPYQDDSVLPSAEIQPPVLRDPNDIPTWPGGGIPGERPGRLPLMDFGPMV